MLSDRRKDLLADLVSQGMQICDIRRIHGFDARTIRAYHPFYRLKSKTARGLSPERRKLLDHLVENGVSVYDIRHTHGFKLETLRRYHPTYRVRQVKNWRAIYNGMTDEQISLFWRLMTENASVTRISREVGISSASVHKLAFGPREE